MVVWAVYVVAWLAWVRLFTVFSAHCHVSSQTVEKKERKKERKKENKYFEFKKLVGRRGAPELELLAVIILFAPMSHETLTNSNFDTNTICQLSHSSSFKCRKL